MVLLGWYSRLRYFSTPCFSLDNLCIFRLRLGVTTRSRFPNLVAQMLLETLKYSLPCAPDYFVKLVLRPLVEHSLFWAVFRCLTLHSRPTTTQAPTAKRTCPSSSQSPISDTTTYHNTCKIMPRGLFSITATESLSIRPHFFHQS